MLWERNYQLREGHLPSVKFLKTKVNAASAWVCSFCNKSGHLVDDFLLKNPTLRPPKCDKCNKSHTGKCSFKKPNFANEIHLLISVKP